MSKWLNNKKIIHNLEAVEKPCHRTGYCPYGQLVEEFPLHPEDQDKKYSCKVFGHDCPVYYHAEFLKE